jgi:DNA polymerase III subunit delta'
MPFRQLAGHRALLHLLARAVARQAVPPSLLFAGPEGVGKRSAALALAQAINCETPVEWPSAAGDDRGLDACGTCASCRRIARGVHADVLVVEPGETGAIKIDQVREAIERTAYRPFEGRRRLVLFDEADALMGEAQNALLKTLEEPPPGSILVLASSRPDVLLPTVRSRCQRLRFGPLSAAEVAAVLVRDHGIEDTEAHARAAASDGSVGRALEEGVEAVMEARGAAARLLATAAAPRDVRRRLQGARALVEGSDRDELARRLQAVGSLLRDIGALSARADDAALANADLKGQIEPLLRWFDAARAVRAYAAVDRALSALERNASPKIVADWIALNI